LYDSPDIPPNKASLHAKRAELIAEIYKRVFNLNRSIQMVMFEYGRREIREELHRKYEQPKKGPWELLPGIDTLEESEEKRVKELSDLSRQFYEFYGTNKIYLSPQVCDLIDRFSTLTAYMAMNYQNVSIKDKSGELMVNPQVKEVWDKAIETIPILLDALEKEFRALLGVNPKLALIG
jgi:hypothetical protein